jgi:methionine--tRNA ligase beta chain
MRCLKNFGNFNKCRFFCFYMENVSFKDWENVDLRVAEILEVEDHPSADKLYVLKIDLGEENPRTLVAGLKGHYSIEELKGKKIIVFANLEPAVLRGIKSEGMLLAAEKDGKIVLASVDSDIGNGAKLH